jgi:hypothetical protein
MVVRDDIEIWDIPNMVGKTMVNHFCGKIVFPVSIRKWLMEN